jgi:2-polyprenyl-3-methyl-5-hydroxy-6-metoxy-1,4-benzoquinol methylase
MKMKKHEIEQCNLCGKSQSKLKYQVDGFDIVQCTDCSLIYLKNPLSITGEQELYDDYYKISFSQDYHRNSADPGLKTLWEINEQRVQMIKTIILNGKLLDVGSGQGFFLYHAQQHGFSVTGVDVSSRAVEFCEQTFHINVHLQNINQDFNPGEKFDVITMWHILEHVSDPLGFVKRLHQYLSPQGKLIIEVPNINSVKFRFASGQNRWIGGNHPRHHKYFFSWKTLRHLLSKAGYDSVEKLNLNYDLSKHSLPKRTVKKFLKRANLDSFLNAQAFGK